MELRWVQGADSVLVSQPDCTLRRIVSSRVLQVGQIARAINLSIIEWEAVEMNRYEVEEAVTFAPNYKINNRYADQLPSVTYLKPLLALRTEQGQLALLDGRQRAEKAFSLGQLSVTAYVVALEQALQYGLSPLANEFTLVRNDFCGSPDWAIVRDMLEGFGDIDLHEPVIARLMGQAEQNGRMELADRLRKLITLDEKGYTPSTKYMLLTATQFDPIVYGGARKESQPEHRFPIDIVSEKRVGKPRLSPEAIRLGHFHQLFCIELILMEEFIAKRVNLRSPYLKVIKKRFVSSKLRLDVAEVGQKYLQQIWRDLGFQQAQVDQFSVMLQYAGTILSETGSCYATLTEFRHELTSDLSSLLQKNGESALVDKHQDLLQLVKVFCKARIRARQWPSIKNQLGKLDPEFKSPEFERRPLEALANKAHEIHEVDPDLDRTAIDKGDLFLISGVSGVVATHVYIEMLKLNELCEAWSYLYWVQRNEVQAYLYLTAALVETWIHRKAIADKGEVDLESEDWKLVFAEYESAGFTDEHFLLLHRQYDLNTILNKPDAVARANLL